MNKLTALEYQKEKKENQYLVDLQAQKERNFHDAQTLRTDLENACPYCHMIRSTYEIQKGLCDYCGMKVAI